MTDKTFKAEVLQSTKTVLVDYRAKWYGPRKMIAPILEAIAEEQGDGHVRAATASRRIEEMTLRDGLIHLPGFLVEAEERRCWRSPSCTPVRAV